jgi:hypothetical protein
MKALLLSIFVIAILTSRVVAQDKFPQLDVLEHPVKVTQGNLELEPYGDVVVLCSSNREEIAAALKESSIALEKFPVGQPFYMLTVDRKAIKDIKELRELAKIGKMPIIHIGYKIEKNVRAPLLLLPTGLIEVDLENIADMEKLEKLVKELDLVIADKHETAVLLQLSGKSKYNFVFDVASTIAKADFVKNVKPMAPVLTRSGDQSK